MRPAQDPVIPLLVGALIAVSVVCALTILVWVWAVRRPIRESTPEIGSRELMPLLYVAVGSQFGLGFDNDPDGGNNWVELLRRRLPEGTRLMTLGRRGIVLADLNQQEIPAAVRAGPDLVTLWSVVSDATRNVPLQDYIRELRRSLTALTRQTKAVVLLLNLPDISLVTQGVSDERLVLIRGGVGQWNREIAGAVARFGRRVRLVDLYPYSERLLGRSGVQSPDVEAIHERNQLLADLVWSAIEKLEAEEH